MKEGGVGFFKEVVSRYQVTPLALKAAWTSGERCGRRT